MKIFTFYFSFLFLSCTCAFGQLVDNFSDGNFSSNPAWVGDASDFLISASNKLQLNGPAATDTSYLSTPNTLINNAEWQMDVNMDLQPSTSNLLRIFLTANNSNLKIADGYILKIGETGSIDGLIFSKRVGGTETQLVKMMDSQLADTPNIRIKVIRDNIGNWSFFAKNYKTGGDFIAIGNITDNSITTTAHFGIACYYTSTRKDKFFFDDFSIASSGPVIDITPPAISVLTPLSTTTLDVLFNEDVLKLTAETISNYSVSNGVGIPSAVVRDVANAKLVHLSFVTPFPAAQLLTLTANNIQDLSANIGNNLSGTFSFGTAPNANFRSVVINEIYPDPDTLAIIPEKEYIELYNTSANAINLNSWKIADPTSIRILPSISIPSNAYLILCSSADTALFSPYGPTLGVGTLPSLNNTGDIITLKDALNNTIDSINYTLSWYHDALKDDGGWSIEQINPFAPCSGIDNWAASTSNQGGTPGKINSIFNNTPDTKSPEALSVNILASNQIAVVFSETISSNGLQTSLFKINNGISINSVNAVGKSAILNLSTPLDSALVYQLILHGVQDCPGNLSPLDTLFFTIGKRGNFNDVLITEIMADPDPRVQLPEVEFVELYNTKNYPINISSWTFADGTSDEPILSGFILPNEYVVLCDEDNVSLFSNYGRVIGIGTFPSLTNSGEVLSLFDENDKLIFSVEYSDKWYANTLKKDGGYTLEMIDIGNPCGGSNNWKASENVNGGTPDQQNSVKGTNPDLQKPLIEDLWVIDSSTIKLFFSEKWNSGQFSNFTFTVDNGMGLINDFVLPNTEPNYLTLNLPIKMEEGILYTLTISGLNDCVGNTIEDNTTIQFGLPQSIEIGDLIINEVLFNPRTNGYDFVELYNKSDKILSSRSLIIEEDDALNGEITEFSNLISTGKLILPKGYMVLTENPDYVKNEYMSKGPQTFLKVSGMPNYLDDKGVVVIRRNNDLVVLDSFAFDKNWHFKLLDDENGVSLERISFEAITQLQSNWHSAAQSVGFATPGYLNSTALNLSLEEEFVVVPEIFSPDQDGFEDFTTINYTVDDFNYVANISIFDIRGRLIRRLVKNETTAQNGFFTWDGIDENGEKADVGIYIISAEFFDTNGNVKKMKGKCVVATKFK